MPDQKPPKSRVCCPRCKTLLNSSNRIPKPALQSWLNPDKKRYLCDICHLKFYISPPAEAKTTPNQEAGGYELPPLVVDNAITKKKSLAAKRRSQNRPQQLKTKPRTSSVKVTTAPDIPGIHNSKEKYAAKRANREAEVLKKELQRLRRIEKKYRALKKANSALAKVASQRRP